MVSLSWSQALAWRLRLVRRNVVDGNLRCKGNDPMPVGGDNKVEGNKEDQCRTL